MGKLAALGGQRLIQAHGYWQMISEDGGETWGEVQTAFQLPDGRPTWIQGSYLVEGDDVRVIGAAPVGNWMESILWHRNDRGKSWKPHVALPIEWNTSEASLTRAKDGALVVSLRTGPPRDYPDWSDHFRRITTARSTDNGLTWTHHQIHFKYGKVHTELLTLPNGDILMTYAARMGELDDQFYHGIEAVLSRDNGKTWDWANRFIVWRWDAPDHAQSVFGPSVRRSHPDGFPLSLRRAVGKGHARHSQSGPDLGGHLVAVPAEEIGKEEHKCIIFPCLGLGGERRSHRIQNRENAS